MVQAKVSINSKPFTCPTSVRSQGNRSQMRLIVNSSVHIFKNSGVVEEINKVIFVKHSYTCDLMQSLDRILSSAKADDKLQTIIDNHLGKDGVNSLLVIGFTFREQEGDSPAFSLGGQITFSLWGRTINFAIGIICISDGFCRDLTEEQLEFVVLHELGHILGNHWAANLFIFLAKDFIVKELASRLRISIGAAKSIVGLAKRFLPSIGVDAGRIEEKIKAQKELEADRYAVLHQRVKEPAISVLQILVAGNMSAPTHVTVDGIFESTIITAGERIEAIRNLILQ